MIHIVMNVRMLKHLVVKASGGDSGCYESLGDTREYESLNDTDDYKE